MPRIKIALWFIAGVFVVNVLLLDYLFVAQKGDINGVRADVALLTNNFKILGGRLYTATDTVPQNVQNILAPTNNAICPTSCVDLILMSTQSGRVPTSSLINPTYQPATTFTTVSKGEYFVPLGTGSVNQTNDWTNIDSAQATFDAGNYGTIKAAYFEAFLHTTSGEVHARLFDSSTPAVFFSSDVKSSSNATQYISAPVSLTAGLKVYKVQMYSTISSGFLDQARIRIVTQ